MDDLIAQCEMAEASPSPRMAPSSMENLELQKRDKARQFSEILLESLTGNDNIEVMQMDDEPIKMEAIDDREKHTLESAPRVKSYICVQEKNCTHETFYPFDMEYISLQKSVQQPAKMYEFKLDLFQKEAIKCLDNQRSVFVSAHPSSGKTVIAIYAIAIALRDNKKLFYILHNNDLSYRKYRELSEEFDDVGLVTADVSLNSNAHCLIVTTEILRSMLYHRKMGDVSCIIFDGIHHLGNKERGFMLEETIFLLPSSTNYLFLSTIIPNAKQFAKWICFLHNQPCHLIYTDYRPVPLQHLVYPAGADGLYEVVDPKGNFKQENFTKAMNFLVEPQNQSIVGEGRPQNIKRADKVLPTAKSVMKIIRTLQERDMLPCIIFSFNRKECEIYAREVKEMDFNSEEEKKAIKLVFENAIDCLSEEDKKLPQVRNVLPYLLRGVGVHHSGLLPIMNEVNEILFREGLIKTLFATETFAMGLNKPVKTVLLTSARKFDGTENRWLSTGEYIQMSGRAGRRGADQRGLVILMTDQDMSADTAMQLIKGTSDPMISQFRLTYNMILNLLRLADIEPDLMLKKSFNQCQNYCSLPKLLQTFKEKKSELKSFHLDHGMELQNYHQIEQHIKGVETMIKSMVLKPSTVVPFFQTGRMMKMRHLDKDFDWGVLVSYRKIKNPLDLLSKDLIYILDVAVMISRESERNLPNMNMTKPPQPRERGIIAVIPFTIECIDAVSTFRLKIPQELRSKEAKETLAIALEETKKRLNNDIPILDPIEDMHLTDPTLKSMQGQMNSLRAKLDHYALKKRTDFDQLYRAYAHKMALNDAFERANQAYINGQKLLHFEELSSMKRVLCKLGYATDDGAITEKGRFACEISSADELLLTEMLFTGAFSETSAATTAALLSCLVFEERAPADNLNEELTNCFRNMQSLAKKIAAIFKECKIEIDEEHYVEKISAGMMNVVYNWCNGATFASIMEGTHLFEGSIINCIHRLEELLQEMRNAAKSLGDQNSLEKFEAARTLLRRDIMFSASLYL